MSDLSAENKWSEDLRTFTQSELSAHNWEQMRIDELEELIQPGEDSPDVSPIPGTFHYHELVDRLHLVSEMLGSHVLRHPASVCNKEMFTKISLAQEILQECYQLAAEKHNQ